MSRSCCLALLVPFALLAGPAQARTTASGQGYSVDLISDYGDVLPTFHFRGDTYILGNYGDRYSIRVHNGTGRRVEAVVTVDGRDVVTGEVGDYVTQRGYLIAPYDSIVIEGFRRSLDRVASFRFTQPSDSYSSRRGTPQHVGVIGVAVFRERSRPRPRPLPMAPRPPQVWDDDIDRDWYGNVGGGATRGPKVADAAERSSDGHGGLDDLGSGSESAAEPRAAAKRKASESSRGDSVHRPRQRNNLGTRYGEDRHSPVVETQFRRARPRRPNQLLTFYYDNADGLARRGIDVRPHYSGSPNPFPHRRFAPAPR